MAPNPLLFQILPVFILLALLFLYYRYLRSISNLEYTALFGSLLILTAQNNPGFLPFCLAAAISFVFLGIKPTRKYIVATFNKLVGSKWCVFIFSMAFLSYWFLRYFPLRQWSWYILADDYPVFLATAKKGFEILKQGGYFGWDSSFLGGYFTAADMSANLIHFLLPFSFLGWETGFHLMLFVFFLSFPILSFYYVRTCPEADAKKALITLPIASFFLLHYFSTLLECGMISAFIGIDLVILGLILSQKLKENKRYPFFFLNLVFTLLFYTHLGMFLYLAIFILIDFLLSPDKKYGKKIFYIACLTLIASLPFLIYKIRYSSYLILDNMDYTLQGYSLAQYLKEIKYRVLHLFIVRRWGVLNKANYPLFFLPILIYMLYRREWKKQAIFIAFVIISCIVIPTPLFLMLSRIAYLTPFLSCVLLAGFLITNYEKKYFAALTIFLSLMLIFLNPYVIRKPLAFNHGRPENCYNQALVDIIKTLDGRYIAMENNQHLNHLGNKIVPDFHWLPLLQLETHKLFFSNYRDGYHHASYRGNSFEGGLFRGRPIDEWAIEDINKVLSNWGIRYLVVWNEKTREYFSNYPTFFTKTWQDDDWSIFRFKNADTRSAVINGAGYATVIDKDYFEKEIRLSDCIGGSKVRIRSNYFPAWRAYYNNREVPLFDDGGQTGFITPASGDYTIHLKYPRYAFLNILAVIALALSGFLSCKLR